jgi:5-methylcytosine-specific restriction endonuclease McrA
MSLESIKVLELNAHYEAIGVITAIRAVVQIIKGKARFEKSMSPPRYVHSTRERYEIPSVIVQTTRYVNVRKRRDESNKKRLRIFIRDHFRCQYCAKRFPAHELTIDHILPQSREGLGEPENLATSCGPCNRRKGARTPDEARMPLLATPSALRYGLDRALLRHYAETRPEWLPYLCLKDEKAA